MVTLDCTMEGSRSLQKEIMLKALPTYKRKKIQTWFFSAVPSQMLPMEPTISCSVLHHILEPPQSSGILSFNACTCSFPPLHCRFLEGRLSGRSVLLGWRWLWSQQDIWSPELGMRMVQHQQHCSNTRQLPPTRSHQIQNANVPRRRSPALDYFVTSCAHVM